MALGPLQADCIYIYQLLQRILVLLRLCLPCEHAEKFPGFVNKIIASVLADFHIPIHDGSRRSETTVAVL